MNNLAFLALIAIIVIIVMIQQIKKVTDRIDANENSEDLPNLYASFSALIQQKVSAIKTDINSSKPTSSPIYVLTNEADEESSLEFLSNCIRKLVFLETMNAKRKPPKEIEKELFEILSALDSFMQDKIKNGEKLSDELREELLAKFNELKK